MGILNELMNRHELYRGDAQASEIFDSLRMRPTRHRFRATQLVRRDG